MPMPKKKVMFVGDQAVSGGYPGCWDSGPQQFLLGLHGLGQAQVSLGAMAAHLDMEWMGDL